MGPYNCVFTLLLLLEWVKEKQEIFTLQWVKNLSFFTYLPTNLPFLLASNINGAIYRKRKVKTAF